MSGTVNTIPSSQIVTVNPFVLAAGGAALDLIQLALDDGLRVPINQAYGFPDTASVEAYFGATSKQAAHARVYFAGFDGSTRLPGQLLMMQYPRIAVNGWLRGGSVASMTLDTLKSLSGVVSVTIDGTTYTSSPITLGSATSFSQAAGIISTALGTSGLTQASVVGSIGATFTGSGSGTNITVTAVQGVIHSGDPISGSGVPTGTVIVSQTSGTSGGNGVYVTSVATTAAAAALTATSSVLDVTQLLTGTVAVGQQLSGPGIPAGTFITALGTGSGGTGTYSITNTFQVVSETITTLTPTVTFDSIAHAFVISSGSTGANSSVGYASGTLSTSLNLTKATGAIVSPGADATDPLTFMSNVMLISQNWATFQTLFDPDGGAGNTQKLLFAQWANSQQNQRLYICVDHDITPTQTLTATASMGYILKQNGSTGTALIYVPSDEVSYHHGAFLGGFIASVNFDELNGRATAAFKTQSGLVPGVTNGVVSQNLQANGYNFYGAFSSTGTNPFNWMYPGTVSGPFKWIDSFINQIWITNELKAALMVMLGQYKSIPYNVAGYAIIRAAILDPATAAVDFGAIRSGVQLSNEQKAYVNNQAQTPIDSVLSTLGWYLQILPTLPTVRADRGSPPMTFWYMDGESVQKINLASILIQ